jgi:hypothetical protein
MMRQAEHVTCMGKKRNAHTFLSLNLKGRDLLEDIGRAEFTVVGAPA